MTTVVTADYTLPAHQVLKSTDEDALQIGGSVWTSITLHGDIVVTGAANSYPFGGVRAETGVDQSARLNISATGSVIVDSDAQGFSFGIAAGGLGGLTIRVVNEGTIEVRTQGEAWGASVSRGGLINHGSITVRAPSSTTGVDMALGGDFFNSGRIEAFGGAGPFMSVVGVRLYQVNGPYQFTNDGTIRAAMSTPRFDEIGVQIAGFSRLTNTGLIEAHTALRLVRDGISTGGGRFSDITNTGTLRGSLWLNNETFEPVVLRNSGVIEGTVTLNNGADTYSGEAGDLWAALRGAAGSDSILGGAASETLSGEAGDDTIAGGLGADRIEGGAGLDHLRGGAGDDLLLGGDEFDNMHGNMGSDTLYGGFGNDWVVGGQDSDWLYGEAGDDYIVANLAADTCYGGDGRDTLLGGQADDRLFGDIGDDRISGDRGSDTLTGGQGADTFDFFLEAGQDRITDFSYAEGDRVHILGGWSYTVQQVGADTVLTMGSDQLVLVGVNAGSLGAGWVFSG